MLVELITKYSELIVSIQIQRFRKERNSYQLIAILNLSDDSILYIKEYLFLTGERKYAYHWQGKDGSFIGRWDNSPHWPDIDTYPRHFHDGKINGVTRSDIRDINGVLSYIHNLIS